MKFAVVLVFMIVATALAAPREKADEKKVEEHVGEEALEVDTVADKSATTVEPISEDEEAARIAKCSGTEDGGRCFAYFPKFRYDKATKKCVGFVYGGCGGNENRFSTADECMAACEGV